MNLQLARITVAASRSLFIKVFITLVYMILKKVCEAEGEIDLLSGSCFFQ